MNRYTFIRFVTVLITLNMPLLAKDTPYLKNIDSFTLQEVKEYLINDLKSMEKFVAFAENNNLRFSISTQETTRPSFNNDRYKILDTNTSKVRIDNVLSTMYMSQIIDYPKSYVLIHLDSDDMRYIFGVEKYSKNFPSIEVKNINYVDKSSHTVKLKTIWKDYNDLYVEINTSKPIKSMGLKMSYTLPLEKEYYISKQEPIVLEGGTIKLEDMNGRRVQISMSNDALKERIIVVDGIHISGKSLRKSGTSMYSHPSKANIVYMKKTSILLKELIGRIDNKSILSSFFGKKNIDSIEALKIELNNIAKPTQKEEKQKTFWTYSFAGDIAKVRMVVGQERTEEHTKELVIKKHPNMQQNSLGYYEARDLQTKKEGFVGKNGQWLIYPKYRKLFMMNDYYYKDEYNNDIYWLNTKKNILEHVEYLINRVKIIDNHLLLSEKVRNQQRGVIDVKTGKTIVPMKYDNVVFDNGLFVAHITDNKKYYIELFNKQGKMLFQKSSKYNQVKIFGVNCIVAKRNGEYWYDDKIDMLNKKGKILSKIKWSRYHGVFGKSKLLLVESWKRISKKEKDTCNWSGYGEKYYCQDKIAFINPKGKVAIDASKYYEVKEFSNGLAAVRDKKTELWGYINTKGRLVIPFIYEVAEYFQNKYAYVKKEGKAFLINKKNKIFKTLPDTANSISISIDRNNAKYYLYNEQTYDADAKLIDGEIK